MPKKSLEWKLIPIDVDPPVTSTRDPRLLYKVRKINLIFEMSIVVFFMYVLTIVLADYKGLRESFGLQASGFFRLQFQDLVFICLVMLNFCSKLILA